MRGRDAGPACGIHGSIKEAAEAMSGTSVRFEPEDGGSARYDKLYEVYEQIYPSLRHVFSGLADALE